MRVAIAMLVLALTLAGCGGYSPDWQEHKLEGLDVALQFPGPPTEGVDGAAETQVNGFQIHDIWPRRKVWNFHQQDRDAGWVVHFSYSQGNVPRCLKDLPDAFVLDQVREVETRFHNRKYVTDSKNRAVERDGIKGIAFESDVKESGKLYWECFVAGGKIHVLEAHVLGKVEERVGRFFASFRRTKK